MNLKPKKNKNFITVMLLIWNWIFFAESCNEGTTSDHYIKKKLKGHIEGAFLSKTKDTLTLASSDLFWKYESAEDIEL